MKYDLAIIGGGPAGYSAALEAIQYGLHVIVFEYDQLGGTCLNRGCVPTKYLEHTGRLYQQVVHGTERGIMIDGSCLDYGQALTGMNQRVRELRDGLRDLFERSGIRYVDQMAEARMNEPGESFTIICKGEEYEADHVLIAAGSVPKESPVAGVPDIGCLLSMNELPRKVKIIGGGVTAVEFANILRMLGTEVTLCLRSGRILKKWDRELAVSAEQLLKKRGICIRTDCTPEDLASKEEDTMILSAVGRRANRMGTTELDLDEDEQGAILTDPDGCTNIPNVYAAGDVVSGSPMLAHTAMEQGKRIARKIAGRDPGNVSAAAKCIYLDPDIVSVGLTEAEAKSQGYEVVTGKQNMRSNAVTMILTDDRCFIKLTADRKERRLLGVQMMCMHAVELAGEFVLAINQKIDIDDLAGILHPHPSCSEAITDAVDALIKKL